MNQQLRQMERAKNFRRTRERLGEIALATATASLRSAEQDLACAAEAEQAAALQALRAREEGRGGDVFLSSALRKAFGLDRARVEKERALREEGALQAKEILRERRVESEQTMVLHRELRERLQAEALKREQAEVVERFLARSRWSSAKVRVRTLTEAA